MLYHCTYWNASRFRKYVGQVVDSISDGTAIYIMTENIWTATQLICSKSFIETPEQCLKSF